MFSFSSNLLAGQHDPAKKRVPPSRPITVAFPALQPPEPAVSGPPSARTAGGKSSISEHFLGLKKPTDVTKDTLALLNVTFQPVCDFETLLSSLSNDAQSHLPPKDWLEPPEHIDLLMSSGAPVTLLSNGRRKPDHNEFFVRARELSFKNADAFSTLSRKSSRGQASLRLAHFRKFWDGLDNLAYYWDNSIDEYSSPSAGKATTTADQATSSGHSDEPSNMMGGDKPAERLLFEQEPRKKARVEAASGASSNIITNLGKIASANSQPSPHDLNRVLPARSVLPLGGRIVEHDKQVDLSKGWYRGYRIGNGAEMPDQYRIDCVRAFLEPIAWAFGVTLSQHRRPPVLKLEHVRFPVRMSSAAWRGPQDRSKARQGWMEGPVLGMQCRSDVMFSPQDQTEAESVLDAVRELGGLLLLAQERAREGKTETRSGEGKWWTTKARWGGGPGGEVGDAHGDSDAPIKATSMPSEDKPVLRNLDGSRARRRPNATDVWKILRPSHPTWDPKTVYEAIGKDRNVAWDDVFMISSLNHHISVLCLRVHPLYLRYLTEGILPDDPPESDWCSPKLQRTRWFDLFSVDDRTEAMRGIWGIMSYLMRQDVGTGSKKTA